MRAKKYPDYDAEASAAEHGAAARAVPRSAKIMAVVKADGYGHGAVTASEAALAGGAEMLAVATVAEESSCGTPASRRRSWCWAPRAGRTRRRRWRPA